MKLPTGVERLDALMDGGLSEGSSYLISGAAFTGKRALARLAFLAALRRGSPAVLVLTNAAACDVRAELAQMDPAYAQYEAAGLAYFIDAYSAGVGANEPLANVAYVDGPLDLNGTSMALNAIEKRIMATHDQHTLILDSVSTLMAYGNGQTVFRFLQVFLGRARRAGASSLLLLSEGMHDDAEVQMIKHLMTGCIELRQEASRCQLRVQGVAQSQSRGWVDYRHGLGEFEITGSFAAGRIR